MKICISTDYHLSHRLYGLEELEQDNYNKYRQLIKSIIKEKPDIHIQLGDIFDTPYPKPISIKHFEDGLKELEKNRIPTYGIIGNHTLVQRKNYYPIDKIFADKMTLLDPETSLTLEDGTFIGGLPYHPKSYDIKPAIDQLYEKAKGCRLKILLLHQALRKDIHIGYDYDEDKIGLSRFDIVLLGHFHKRIHREENGTVYHYPGSLNSCSIAEMKDEMETGRGYTVLDTSTGELTMRTLPPERQYIQYDTTTSELNEHFITDTIKSLKGYSRKPVVQLNITGNDTRHIYETVKKLEPWALSVRHKTIKINEDDLPITDTERDIGNIEDMLRKRFSMEWQGDLAVDLFRSLSRNDTDSAKGIARNIYNKQYR